MTTIFDDNIDHITQKKETGLLSLFVKDLQTHFKMYFLEGNLYRMIFGALRDEGCLKTVDTLEVVDCLFAPGIKLPVNDIPTLDTASVIQRLKRADKTRKRIGTVQPGPAAADASSSLDKLKTAFIRQVGPLGDMVFNQVYTAWHPPAAPTKQQLMQFVELIREKIIDDEGKREFQQDAENILS
ncbi:MAG TPA: hypothetical protein VK654_17460 [Nitrospirota bacterium]|nr:hypothetical protein [Nitrospirota bacterium]